MGKIEFFMSNLPFKPRKNIFARCAILLLASLLHTSVLASPTNALALVRTIALPDVKGQFDHVAVDENNHRLFVAALGNNTLEVADVAEGKQLKSVVELHRPTGIIYLPEQNRVAVANSDEGMLAFYDGKSLNFDGSVTGLLDTDNVRLDSHANRIYVGYGDGALGVVDVATAKQVGSIKLSAHPESFQLEQTGNRIFVNLPDAKQIAVIDRDKLTVTATWPMEKFHANFPMALDEANHRLFVGCRSPAGLAVLDTTTGKVVADIAISGDTDDLFYDAKRQHLYVICGEGFVDIIQQRTADKYEAKETIPTRVGARTGWFSPALDQLYIAVPERGGKSAELRIFDVHN